jgi:hypothetical protein
MTARATVHQIVDRLSDDELDQARHLLERLHSAKVDPMLKLLASAADDDEGSSQEEDATAAKAWDQRDDSLTAEEAKKRLL